MFGDLLNISIYREGDAIKIKLEELRFSQQGMMATHFDINSFIFNRLAEIHHLSKKKLRELLQIKTTPFIVRFRFSELNYGQLPHYFFSSYNRHVYSDISFTLPTQIHLALDCFQALSEHIARLSHYLSHDEKQPIILLNAKSLIADFDAALVAELVAVRGPMLLPDKNALLALADLSESMEREISEGEAAKLDAKERLIGYLVNKTHEALPIATSEAAYIQTGKLLAKETALSALFAVFKAFDKPKTYQRVQNALDILAPANANAPCTLPVSLRTFERYHLLFNIDGRALLNPAYGISEKYRLLRQLHHALVNAGEIESYKPYLIHVQFEARKRLLAACKGKPAADGGVFHDDYTEVSLIKEAKFIIREDGKIGIQCAGSPTYERDYAPGCHLHNVLQAELAKLFAALDLEIEPDCSYHEEIVLTRESSKQVMLMGLHLTPDLELPHLGKSIGLFSVNETIFTKALTNQPARMAP